MRGWGEGRGATVRVHGAGGACWSGKRGGVDGTCCMWNMLLKNRGCEEGGGGVGLVPAGAPGLHPCTIWRYLLMHHHIPQKMCTRIHLNTTPCFCV
jgi:hypothetical protein